MLSKVESLSIYRTEDKHIMEQTRALCTVLQHCDLGIFRMEESRRSFDGMDDADAVQLFSCLQQHRNLRAFALGEMGLHNLDCKIIDLLEIPSRPPIWPQLQALDLDDIEIDWLEEFPKFAELQIFLPGL